MLAGILLEDPGIYLSNLAVISTMRAVSPAPYTFLRHVWSAHCAKYRLFSSLAAALSVTTVLCSLHLQSYSRMLVLPM